MSATLNLDLDLDLDLFLLSCPLYLFSSFLDEDWIDIFGFLFVFEPNKTKQINSISQFEQNVNEQSAL